MSDYKYDIQLLAEEIAEYDYGKDYYDLDDDEQYTIYLQAEEQYWDRKNQMAEAYIEWAKMRGKR